MSPAASSTTSPGTSCETAISWGWPSRITVAVTEIMALSLAAALSALASWMSFSPTPRAIISDITIPARASPVANEMLASTASRITSGLSTACQSSLPSPARWSLARTFGPYSASRARASSVVSPSGRVENRARTDAISIVAASTKICETWVCGLSSRMAARSFLGRIPEWTLNMQTSSSRRPSNTFWSGGADNTVCSRRAPVCPARDGSRSPTRMSCVFPHRQYRETASSLASPYAPRSVWRD